MRSKRTRANLLDYETQLGMSSTFKMAPSPTGMNGDFRCPLAGARVFRKSTYKQSTDSCCSGLLIVCASLLVLGLFYLQSFTYVTVEQRRALLVHRAKSRANHVATSTPPALHYLLPRQASLLWTIINHHIQSAVHRISCVQRGKHSLMLKPLYANLG